MDSRTGTPDLLKEVLSEKETENAVLKIFPQAEEKKERTTFNLPVILLRELEKKVVRIRAITNSKVTKTLAVEEALKMAFNYLDQEKEQGQFFLAVVKHQNDRSEGIFPQNQEEKEKATFNLTLNILRELEKRVARLRAMSESKVRKAVVVEEALKMALKNFDQEKEFGEFFLGVVKHQNDRSKSRIQKEIRKKEAELIQLKKSGL